MLRETSPVFDVLLPLFIATAKKKKKKDGELQNKRSHIVLPTPFSVEHCSRSQGAEAGAFFFASVPMHSVLQRCMRYLSRDTAAWRHSLPVIWSTSCVRAFTHRHWKDACTNNRDNRMITLIFLGFTKVLSICEGHCYRLQNWLWQSKEHSFNLYYADVTMTAASVMVPQSSVRELQFFRDQKIVLERKRKEIWHFCNTKHEANCGN